VAAYGGPCKFSITADAVLASDDGTTAASTQIVKSEGIESEVTAGQQRCSNCAAIVPDATYAMHTAFCRRNNWKCPTCAAIVRIVDKDKGAHSHCPAPGCVAVLKSPEEVAKHVDLKHTPQPCDMCGVPVHHAQYEAHIQRDCEYRRVNCVYCKLSVPAKDIHAHEAKCGGRTVSCDMCGQLIARKRLDRHKAVDHHLGDASIYGPETPLLTGTPFTPVGPQATTTTVDALGANLGALGLDEFSIGDSVPVGPAGPAAVPLARSISSEAVTCPVCSTRLGSFEECQVHLVFECPQRGSEKHLECVRNLVGEEAAAQVTTAPTTEAAEAPVVVEPTPTAVTAPLEPPRRQERRWMCPMCKELFAAEDECQIHVLTDCKTPWEDPSTALDAITRVPFEPDTGPARSAGEAEGPTIVRRDNAFAALADSDSDSDSAEDVARSHDAGSGIHQCPSCGHPSDNMEDLHVHMFTECPKAAEHTNTLFS
jgi:hypothetical protein